MTKLRPCHEAPGRAGERAPCGADGSAGESAEFSAAPTRGGYRLRPVLQGVTQLLHAAAAAGQHPLAAEDRSLVPLPVADRRGAAAEAVPVGEHSYLLVSTAT